MVTRFIATLTATLVISGPAFAQDYVPMFTPDFAGNMAWQNMVTNDIERNSQRAATDDRTAARSTGDSRAVARTVPSATSEYRASPAVTSRVKEQFVEFMQQHVDADGVQQMRSVLQNGDPVASWASIVRSDGLRSGDLVDSMTAYWMLNWVMANQSDNNRTQMMAARDQVRRVVSSDPGVSSLDNAERQEMSEAMMLNFLVQHAAYGDAMQKGDRVMMRRLGDAAVARFRNEMGVDLRQLRLTDQGFVPGA